MEPVSCCQENVINDIICLTVIYFICTIYLKGEDYLRPSDMENGRKKMGGSRTNKNQELESSEHRPHSYDSKLFLKSEYLNRNIICEQYLSRYQLGM